MRPAQCDRVSGHDARESPIKARGRAASPGAGKCRVVARESGGLPPWTATSPRLLDPVIHELLAEFPALLIVGPRATGKTTTAARHAATTVRLDRAAEDVAVEADPDAALAELPTPALLDELQAVPGVLGAVKRAVDHDPRPGRFLHTGSVRADLDHKIWPGSGRLVRLRMMGMTQSERLGLAADYRPFLDRLADREAIGQPASPPDLRGYLAIQDRSLEQFVEIRFFGGATGHWSSAARRAQDLPDVDSGGIPARSSDSQTSEPSPCATS